MSHDNNSDEEIKEEFCGACLAVPLAMAGAGAGAAGSSTQSKVLMWAGVSLAVISILVAIYFLFIKKNCNKK